jgi:RNA polymerase sigma factor (sigma-70 family)
MNYHYNLHMIRKDSPPPIRDKKAVKERLPIPVQLENQFSIKDLHEKKSKVVNAIFEFYYPELDNKIPDWLRDVAITDDGGGIAAEVLLDVIDRCERYGSFKELDEDINSTFEKSKHKASSQAGAKKYNWSKENKLDAPIKSSEKQTQQHDVVADQNAKDGLEILINNQAGLANKTDRERAVEERQKGLMDEAAEKTLSAMRWNIYNLHINKHMSIEEIATVVNKTQDSITRSIGIIRRDIQSYLFPGIPRPDSSVEGPLDESDQVVVLRAYRTGIPFNKIQKRFNLSQLDVIQLVEKVENSNGFIQGRDQAVKRQVYQAYATNIPEDDIIRQFDLKDKASLQKIVRQSGQEAELKVRRTIDRSKPTHLDTFSEKYARQEASGKPVDDAVVKRRKNELIAAADAALSSEKRKIFFLYYQEGLSYSEIAKLQGKPNETIYSYVERSKKIVLKYAKQKPAGRLKPLDDWAIKLIDPSIEDAEEIARLREETKKKLITAADIALSPKAREIFSLYFERGLKQVDVATRAGRTLKTIDSDVRRMKEAIIEQLNSVDEILTPLDMLAMEGQDFTGKANDEIELLRNERKKKILKIADETLSEDQRREFRLYYEEGLNRAETGRAVGKSESAIRNALYQSKKSILDFLKPPPDLTPLDLFVREGEDENQAEENLQIVRDEKKTKILANVKNALKSKKEKIFSLHFQQGMEREKVAKLMGISRADLAKNISEIKKILTKGLDKNFAKKATPLEIMAREGEDTSLSPEEIELARTRKKSMIIKAADTVLDQQRQKVFSLYFVEGHIAKEVARLMKVKQYSVEDNIKAIRQKIGAQLVVVKKETEKTAVTEAHVCRAYRMGVSYIKIMERYGINSYTSFYNIISDAPDNEEIVKGRQETDNRLTNRICADYADNMLMEDMQEKYQTTHTTIFATVRKTGKAYQLLQQRKFTYKALGNDRQRQVAALFTFQSAMKTAKSMSTHTSFVYRDKDTIKEKLGFLETIPETDPEKMPDKPFSLIGRSAGMFAFDKNMDEKFTALVLKAKEQGHLGEVYFGMARTIDDIESHPLDSMGKLEAKTVFKRAALDIVARCGEASPDDPSYKKVLAYIVK